MGMGKTIATVNDKQLNVIDQTYPTGQKQVPTGLSTAELAIDPTQGVISGVAGDVSAAAGTTGGMNVDTGQVVKGNRPMGLGDMNNLTTV